MLSIFNSSPNQQSWKLVAFSKRVLEKFARCWQRSFSHRFFSQKWLFLASSSSCRERFLQKKFWTNLALGRCQ